MASSVLSNKTRRRRNLHKSRLMLRNPLSIHQRPSEVQNRQQLGHWEGDLIIGVEHRSAIATLVERSSCYVITTPLVEGKQSIHVNLGICASLGYLPKEVRKSITWDRGSEMCKHEKITELLNMPIYFADPYSAWQRESNENTNGLLRDYFPKSTDFNQVSWFKLLEVTNSLNNRPRKTLNYTLQKRFLSG